MRSVRTRIGAVVVALALASGLAACQTNAGAAATVDGKRISESDVTDLLTSTGTAAGRNLVVAFLVQEKLYERALQKKGQLPSAAQLNGSAAGALSLLFGQQVPAAQANASLLDPTLTKDGVRTRFDATILRAAELEYAFIQTNKIATAAQLAAVVKAARVPVSVSPRYGRWNAATVQLDQAATPDFLKTSSAPAPAASPGA